jgi:hypothetical protein
MNRFIFFPISDRALQSEESGGWIGRHNSECRELPELEYCLSRDQEIRGAVSRAAAHGHPPDHDTYFCNSAGFYTRYLNRA